MTPPSETNAAENPPLRRATQKKRTKKKLNGGEKKNTVLPTRPRKSLIRQRPVSFGNPALGTYNGCLYTWDVVGEDYSPINRPIIEGAESVERVVAMVDVPPDQVPEGILNLARSHRPYLHHVRIVIAESNNEEVHVDPLDTSNKNRPLLEDVASALTLGQEETKDQAPDNGDPGKDYGLPLQSTSLAAASIIAADEEQGSAQNTHNNVKEKGAAVGGKGERNDNIHALVDNDSDPVFEVRQRTYLVLLELCSVDAAEVFVEDLHNKPYTVLDPTQKCSVHHVLALTGEDGVSLLSPFFAPTAKSASPKANTNGSKPAILSSSAASTSASSPGASAMEDDSSPPVSTSASKTPIMASPAPPAPIVEDYNCAVCLEHMVLTDAAHDDIDASRGRSSVLTTVCNHSFHMDCLLKWQDSPCPVCRYDHSGLNEALSQCHICGRTENNYVCLICGVVSCGGPPIRRSGTTPTSTSQDRMHSQSPVCGGRTTTTASNRCGGDGNHISTNNTRTAMENPHTLSQSHARKHYDQTLHAYALDTETQHVWDFAGQGYVHRLLQNKEDGKLVEFHNPSNTSSHERSQQPGLSDTQEGEVVHRKLEGYASQYYTLLKSQLEQQRIYYEGRLEELRRESLVRKKAQTSDLIHALKQEKAQLSKRVVSLKTRHCKVVDDASFLKNMNESLEANKGPLKHKVKEAQRQRVEARDQVQQCLPVLEEKVTVLLQELTGETHNGDEQAAAGGENQESAPKTDMTSQSDDRKPAPQP